ncbi:MAG: RDD family protein [Steroidobacter sp.]
MNTPSDQSNRYAAPQAEVQDVDDDHEVGQLAGRGERLGAILLDWLVFVVLCYLPILIGLGTSGIKAIINFVMTKDRSVLQNLEGKTIAAGFAIAGVGALIALIINIYFVVKNRQTIGKKLMKIKVTRTDGSTVSIARLFFLRNVVNALPGMIPIIGRLYFFVDSLFIFREPRRCVHDYIADTIVVKA